MNLQQQTNEWLEWRKSKIGASDAGAILGISPWKTAYQLWEEKIGLKDPDPINERMLRGIELEPKARMKFEEMTGIKVNPEIWVHREYAWMVASLDGMSDDNKHMVEIKCAGSKDHELAKNGKIPDHYYPQLQHQMEVTGLNSSFYFSFDGEEGIIIKVERDQKYIDNLIKEEKQFYHCMNALIPPDQKYITRSDKLWLELERRYVDTSRQRKWLEKQEEDLKNSLIQLSGGSNTKGENIKLSKVVKKGSLDVEEMEKHFDVESFRKSPKEFWKVTIGD